MQWLFAFIPCCCPPFYISLPRGSSRLSQIAKDMGSLGEELRAQWLLGLSRAEVGAGEGCFLHRVPAPPACVLSPSRVQDGPRSGWEGAVQASAAATWGTAWLSSLVSCSSLVSIAQGRTVGREG